MKTKIIIFLTLFTIIFNLMAQNKIETVKNLSLDKYLGKWYEIYRMPFKYEKDLMNVTATYALKKNGKISVLNEGYVGGPNGKHKIANGKAKIPDINQPGRLRVSFFGPFYADYLIVALDTENYQWSLVVTKNLKQCWILARRISLPQETVNMLIEKAKSLGVDVSKFIKVDQSWK